MEIKLERDISTESFEAIMEIASFDEKYKFILPFLKLEEEGGITVEQVNTKLLDKTPDNEFGRSLLERMEKFRLIERAKQKPAYYRVSDPDSFYLTEKGEVVVVQLQDKNFDKIDPPLRKDLLEARVIAEIRKSIWDTIQYSLGTNSDLLLGHPWPYTPSGLSGTTLFLKLEQYGIVSNRIYGNYSPTNDEDDYKLTDLGKKALQEGKVPIPEKGLYVLYTTEDPLFHEKLVAYEPKTEGKRRDFKEKAFNQKDAKKTDIRGKGKNMRPQRLDFMIKSLKNSPKIIELAAQNGEEIQLIGVEGEINPSRQKKKISIVLKISSGHTPQMEVFSNREGKDSKYVCTPNLDLTLIEILKQLDREHADYIIDYDQKPSILVTFDEIKNNAAEVNSGERKLTIKSPEIDGIGP
ncbi:hypothetical protein, partial [Methanocalculus sp.]|uniref:hypothetical protein n=1 Tax=Methanocalculus sp. TaxID=2004547 RepID=UPI00262B3ACD